MNSSEKLEVQINLFILRAEKICLILYYLKLRKTNEQETGTVVCFLLPAVLDLHRPFSFWRFNSFDEGFRLYIDESDITTWNNVYLSYVYLGTFCEQAYHENEINAYIAEITNIKDVTSIYDANRKYLLWVNQEKLKRLKELNK